MATVGKLPVIDDEDTPVPVENAPPGGETTVTGDDSILLGGDVSEPPTVQGVTDGVNEQHGEVGEELASAAVLTSSVETRRQVTSDGSDTNIFATPGDALPTSADRLIAELVEFRVELSAQFTTQNEKFNT